MKLFHREKKKEKEKEILKTKDKMLNLFKNTITDYQDYKILYAYNSYLENGSYKYQSLIIAYRQSDFSLIIIETDKNFKESFNTITLKRGDFSKSSYSKNTNTYRFYVDDDPIIFSIIDKNYKDTDILALIDQEIEMDDFYEFYIDFKKKPRLRKRKKK